LGNDFLSSKDVQIKYSQDNRTVLINNKRVNLLTETGTTNFVNISTLSAALVAPSNSHDAHGWDGLNQTMDQKPLNKETPTTEKNDEKERLQEFFSLDSDTDMVEMNAFMQSCKEAKYSYHCQTIFANSIHQTNLDDIVASDFEKRSIIPEEVSPRPSPAISHLSRDLQIKIKYIISRHD
jgi:hypothetical protein